MIAANTGIGGTDICRQASTLVSGLTVGNFFQDQAVFDVAVRGAASVRNDAGTVRNLLIDTQNGGQVRLGDIAQVSIHPCAKLTGRSATGRPPQSKAKIVGSQIR